jgi:TRAP-type C4-dicarboxylate transport system permease small subunit
MGAAAMVYEKRHFAFTSAADMIKNKKAKLILALVIDIIMIIFTILMTKYGYDVTKQFWNYTWNNIPSFKRGPTWICLPLSGLTASIYLLAQIVEIIMNLVKGGDK